MNFASVHKCGESKTSRDKNSEIKIIQLNAKDLELIQSSSFFLYLSCKLNHGGFKFSFENAELLLTPSQSSPKSFLSPLQSSPNKFQMQNYPSECSS